LVICVSHIDCPIWLCLANAYCLAMQVSVVVGTRPEIVKMAPLYFALKAARLAPRLVHSGQHYDFQMSKVFFDELGLPEPHSFLGIGSGSPGDQTGKAIVAFEKEFVNQNPDCVLVEGDTNTVLAAALAAAKRHIKVGHVEAGLRSYDLRMPEELNRRLADHVSAFLFAPTEESVRILKGERVWGRVYRTGNTVIDATLRYLPKAIKRSKIMDKVPWDSFALATLHRAENVDNPETLESMSRVLTDSPAPVVLPLHPRTDLRLREYGLKDAVEKSGNVLLLPPVGYYDMLVLMKKAQFILTDSGGIQEEACSPVLKKRVFVMRLSTERPEAVKAGYCKVVGTDQEKVLREVRRYVENPRVRLGPCPYGNGDAAERIASALKKDLR
jgi:UDP-N-acetylglucosamine 2-epimerase (non-hydrolysing)